jgi:DNA-binding LacI/PurR family transcriptional regulator
VRAAGLDVDQTPVRYARDTTRGGYLATRDLLEAQPQLTAIFATNDLPALGALHAAADLGLQVPDDLSVVGITDIQLAQESRPALTTVAVPTVEAAELAVSLLRELIEASPRGARAAAKAPRVCVTSAPELIVRGSTQTPRRDRS